MRLALYQANQLERSCEMTEQPVRRFAAGRSRLPDGKTEIELPSRRYTQVFWDADIIDLDDKNKADTILGTEQPSSTLPRRNAGGCGVHHRRLAVRRRFKPIGPGPGFYLSRFSPATRLRGQGLEAATGCASSSMSTCLRTRSSSGRPGHRGLRDAAKVELRCCDGHSRRGYEALEEYEFFRTPEPVPLPTRSVAGRADLGRRQACEENESRTNHILNYNYYSLRIHLFIISI